MGDVCDDRILPVDRPALYLIPTPLSAGGAPWLIAEQRSSIARISTFFVENERSARRFLASLELGRPVSALALHRFDKESSLADARKLLEALPPHESAGVLSEAGVPCVADPGALLVRAAHERGLMVRPMVGPSSILLALMASGLNGQQFTFHGYAPIEQAACRGWLSRLEETSRSSGYSQLFIETPYRTTRIFAVMLETLRPATLVSIAHDIGGESELFVSVSVKSARVSEIKLHPKAPTVFGLLAVN
jgi:16S rRNA (cytidine1402-2'-O)-methyltransferase